LRLGGGIKRARLSYLIGASQLMRCREDREDREDNFEIYQEYNKKKHRSFFMILKKKLKHTSSMSFHMIYFSNLFSKN